MTPIYPNRPPALGNGLMSNILDVFLLNKNNEQLWNGCVFALHFIIYNTQVGGWGEEKLVSHFQFVCVILASFVVAGTKLPPPLGSRRYWTSKLSSFPPYLAFSISSLILFLRSICSAHFCQIFIFFPPFHAFLYQIPDTQLDFKIKKTLVERLSPKWMDSKVGISGFREGGGDFQDQHRIQPTFWPPSTEHL